MRNYLFLFDIDGTLINTGGAGLRSISRVLKETFGINDNLKKFSIAGRTDLYILKNIIKHFNLGDKSYNLLKSEYLNVLKEEIQKENQNKSAWTYRPLLLDTTQLYHRRQCGSRQKGQNQAQLHA